MPFHINENDENAYVIIFILKTLLKVETLKNDNTKTATFRL